MRAGFVGSPGRRQRWWYFAVAGVAVVFSLAPGLRAEGRAGRRPHSGGTLRVVSPVDFASLDPALARPLSFAIWYATCATLTAFRDGSWPPGLMLRPEAAGGPPKVSRGGRRYVFTIRRGLRFSDG